MVVMLDRRSSSGSQSIRVEGEIDHPSMLMMPIGGGSYFLYCECGWTGYVQIDATGGVAPSPDLNADHRRLFERGLFSDQIIES